MDIVVNPYIRGGEVADTWAHNEAGRLRNMAEFLGGITAEDLSPLITSLQQEDPAGSVTLVDIGAGTGDSTEKYCAEQGVTYVALDGNASFLEARPNTANKVLGRSEALPFADGSFDITYSRAVTAWNADPQKAIAEQLRATRLGGVAVFTEFDWSASHADVGSPVFEALMTARAVMMASLSKVGFKPEYGKILGNQVERVAEAEGYIYDRQEIRHELPPGDYRDLFLDAANSILEQLQAANPAAADMLGNALRKIEQTPDAPCFTLPAVVTQVIHLYDPNKLAIFEREPWIDQIDPAAWIAAASEV